MTESNTTLIGLHSEWVEQSQMRCRVRRVDGPKPRILVDVLELSPNESTHKTEAMGIARSLAVLNGAHCDPTELCDLQSDRKAVRLKDDVQVMTRARQFCWAFGVIQ